MTELEGNKEVIFEHDSWYLAFEQYVNENFLEADDQLPAYPMSEAFFREKLTQFLFSPSGAKFMREFVFNGTIKCGEPAPDVSVRFAG